MKIMLSAGETSGDLHGAALAIEAGKTLFIDKERAVALAEANGITIAAL